MTFGGGAYYTHMRLAALAISIIVVMEGSSSAQSAVPDLSGDWAHQVIRSLSQADPMGARRGQEPDIPYQPWAREKTLSEVPPVGDSGRYEDTTDPAIHYCEPLGLARVYMYPGKVKFVQTPEAVYILDETGPSFRVVWMNAAHPEDPDPQYWGHSIGRYENGTTLVVDTVGVNDRSWLDHMAHPHTEQLHLIERYARVDRDTLRVEITVDDPGAYTRPFTSTRNFRRSDTGFLRYQWVCSVRDNNEHYAKVGKAGTTGATTFK